MKTPNRLSLARLPTPFQPLDRLSDVIGGPRIWIKRDDLTEGIGSGNKIRKLEFVLSDALAHGADVLVTSGGLQSNHCRATALCASQLGIKCHLVLRGRPQTFGGGNLLLDYLLGATVQYASANDFLQLEQLHQKIIKYYINQGNKPYLIPIGASNALGMWGYIEATKELKNDYETAEIEPSHLFSAVGSGGTFGGLLVGKALYGLTTQLRGVCVAESAAYFRQKLEHDMYQWQVDFDGFAAPCVEGLLEHYVGAGYGIASEDDFAIIQQLARLEGIILDPVYTAKAFRGMVDTIRRESISGGDVVFLHTGGVFGLFPQMSNRQLSELKP